MTNSKTEIESAATGAWIFVSHSHKDIDKVRKIRNVLEGFGHNPLLFYLKCLTDEDLRLPQLLADEIKAREWFVLCDSPNARASAYVTQEMTLVKALKEKVVETVDLSQDVDAQLYKIVRLAKRAKVYVTYGGMDREVGQRILNVLKSRDFDVLVDKGFDEGIFWGGEYTKANIQDAVQCGFVLALLSPWALKTGIVEKDIKFALETAGGDPGKVIPIIVTPLPAGLPAHLENLSAFDMTSEPFDLRMEELIKILKTRPIA